LHLKPLLTRLGAWAAHPAAFAIVLGYAATWLMFERYTFDWHAVATLATWLMTLVITRAEYRDTQAIHAKLDELLRVHGEAEDKIRNLDDDEPEEIVRHREGARAAG
jgi:low affinity Fe/Cu permease